MIPGRIEGWTRYLGAPKGWKPPEEDCDCVHLAIRDHDGVMSSVWEPTPKELERLALGAKVYLFIAGSAHPPVGLEVGPIPDALEQKEGRDA